VEKAASSGFLFVVSFGVLSLGKGKMVLYKYTQSKYLVAFFETGKLKIGTLHGYRNQEKLGDAIGDDDEGISGIAFNIAEGKIIHMDGSTPEAQFLANGFEGVKFGTGGTISALGPGAGIFVQQQSPDFYIFCAANEFNEDQMNKFGGSCFEISAPKTFIRTISREIRDRATFVQMGQVVYKDRNTTWDRPHNVHESMMKGLKYAEQKEVRAIWAGTADPLIDLYIEAPDLIKYCRRV
jgi:hypothetical protein